MKRLMKKALSLLLVVTICISNFIFSDTMIAKGMQIPEDAVKFNGHYYKVFDTFMTWMSAKDYCESIGGHLVVITSKEENSFITSLVSSFNATGFSIGFSDWENEGEWVWVTGEHSEYINWGMNQPDGCDDMGGQDVGRICGNANEDGFSIGQWDDVSINNERGFVCEWEPNEQIITGEKTGSSTDNKIKIDDVWYEYDTSVVGLKETINKFPAGTIITCKLRFGKIVACSKNEINSVAIMSIKTPNNTIQYDATTKKYNPESISLDINITNRIKSSSRGKIDLNYIAGYDITFDKIVINVKNGDMLYFKDGIFDIGKTQEFEKEFDSPVTLKAGESFDFNDYLTAYINDYKWGETELEKKIQISATAYNGDDVVTSTTQNITFKNNTAEDTMKNNDEIEDESEKAAGILDKTKLIISDAFLSDVFTKEQLKAIHNALQCKIALCALPESTYKQAGFEDKVIEKLMKKAGVSKEWLGTAYRADIILTVNVDTEKYGQLKVTFNMPIDYYAFGSDNPYGATNFGFTYEIEVLKKGKNEIPDDKLSGKALSLGTYVNMNNFSNSVKKVALAQLESAYNLGYGNDANKVGDMLFGDTINKILSKTSAQSYSHLTFTMMTLPTKKAIVRCPVDVYVYDADGNLCASVENNEITMTCEDVDIEVIGDEKYITIYEGDYSLEIIATANDEMNITIEEYSNSDEKVRTVSYNDIALAPGDSFKTDVNEVYLENEYEIIKNEEESISADSDETYVHRVDSVKIVDKESTCGRSGKYHIECATCSEVVSTGIIPATGHNNVDGVCTLCGERIVALGAMSSQIRFDRNADNSYAGTFAVRTRAMISDEDFKELIGATNEEAANNIDKIGFVYTVDGENFSVTSAQAVAQGEKVSGYVDAPVSYVQDADGYYMFTCLVTDIPDYDKDYTLFAYAYVCVNGKWYFSEEPMTADFSSLYSKYYPIACEKYGW